MLNPSTRHITWLANGNNISVNEELLTHALIVRFDSIVEDNTKRDFKYPDLKGYCYTYRDKILNAHLSLIMDWFDLDAPTGKASHRMSKWAEIISGIMEHAGWQGLSDNRIKEIEESTLTEAIWNELFGTIHNEYGEKKWNVKSIYTIANDEDMLGYYLRGDKETERKRHLPHLLKGQEGQIRKGLKLQKPMKMGVSTTNHLVPDFVPDLYPTFKKYGRDFSQWPCGFRA